MKEETDRPACHRADDLISFLYGEASATEAAEFAGHLDLCASCRTEFAIFRGVRESVSEWRSEVLGAGWRPQQIDEAEQLPAFVTTRPLHRASALAALREFFTIAPMWLRGAAALATLVFCLLATFFMARMVGRPERLYSVKEFNAELERRMAELNKDQGQPTSSSVASVPVTQPSGPEEETTPTLRVRKVKHASQPRSRQFLSRAEREQLAADLGLKPSNEEELLSFPLDGGSN